ncbi:MAG: response regulator [Candidatus Acidiferrales bacterium]
MSGTLAENPGGKPLRILIADDQPFVRRAVRALLETHEGWRVCGEASNGCEAIKQNDELKPDVIVMDLVMPQMNGLEATRRIRESSPRPRVLILTLYDLPELNRVAQDAGAQACVLKSESIQHLVAAVANVTGTQPAN